MRVALNVYPLKSAHKNRGIGTYTRNLLTSLKNNDGISVVEFTNLEEVKDADIIHYPWFDLFSHTLPLWEKKPLVVTVHDVMPLIFPQAYPVGVKGKASFILQKLALKGARAIITDSVVSKTDIKKYLSFDEKKIKAIPLAADPKFKVLPVSEQLRARKKYNIPDHYLLYVGDANYIKNLPFLISGFKNLKDAGFNNLKLILIGEVFLKKVDDIDHPELTSIKKVNNDIKQLGLENDVLRPGYIDLVDLVAFYNLATVYIQPSLYEGFGLPVLEAMKCGTPVACSNISSLKEIAGNCAFYFDPKNLNQFTKILVDIIESKSVREKYAKLGLNQVEKFSWRKVVDETISVYKESISA